MSANRAARRHAAKARPKALAADLAEARRQIDARVQSRGWVVIMVPPERATEPALAYTVGLRDRALPEVFMTGLPLEVMEQALSLLARRVLDGESFAPETPIDRILQVPVMLRHVHAELARPYVSAANDRVGRPMDALQLLWPDPAGLFPDQLGFDQRFAGHQPRFRS